MSNNNSTGGFVRTNRILLKENPTRFCFVSSFKFKLYRFILFFDLQCKLHINSIFMISQRCESLRFLHPLFREIAFHRLPNWAYERVRRHTTTLLEVELRVLGSLVSVHVYRNRISQHFFMCFCSDTNNSISNRCFCCYCNSEREKIMSSKCWNQRITKIIINLKICL